MSVTAETITWAQLQEVARMDCRDEDLGDFATPRELASYAAGGHPGARQRCAELLNARKEPRR